MLVLVLADSVPSDHTLMSSKMSGTVIVSDLQREVDSGLWGAEGATGEGRVRGGWKYTHANGRQITHTSACTDNFLCLTERARSPLTALVSFVLVRVLHGYTVGMHFHNRNRNRKHLGLNRYGYKPIPNICGATDTP